jgi:hypothetical protein
LIYNPVYNLCKINEDSMKNHTCNEKGWNPRHLSIFKKSMSAQHSLEAWKTIKINV